MPDDWQIAYSETLLIQRATGDIRLLTDFPFDKSLLIKVDLLTGLGMSERSLGMLYQEVEIEGFEDVKGEGFELKPGTQLFIPPTELDYRLIFQPIKRSFSLTLSIWIGPMPITRAAATVQPVTSSNAAHSNVGDLTTDSTLLAANSARKGVSIFNNSSAILYVQLGAVATDENYYAALNQGDYCEVPFGYTGVIHGLWSANTTDGSAQVIEFT